MTPVIFHNSKELQRRGTGPYFYLRKLESHLKVRVWSNISCFAEDELCVPSGSIRAAVLIEAIQPCSKRVKSSMNDSWLRGSGCIPIRYLMEGAATAEICHAQIWQCDKHDAP